MGSQWRCSRSPPGLLVHHGNDRLVSHQRVQDANSAKALTAIFSIALPWCFVREVPVDIELVSGTPYCQLLPKNNAFQ